MTVFLKVYALQLMKSNVRNVSQIRFYARWSHRRPIRVFTPEEYKKIEERPAQNLESVEKYLHSNEDKIIELDYRSVAHEHEIKLDLGRSSTKWVPRSFESSEPLINVTQLDQKPNSVNDTIETKMLKKKKVSYKTKQTINNSLTTVDMLETVIDSNGDLIYTKLKDKDPVVSQLLLTVKSRKTQSQKDLVLLEGKTLIKEALEAKCTLKSLIFSRKDHVEYLKPYLPKSGARLFKMSYREIQMWSDLTTTPGIMGIFKTPNVKDFVPRESLELTVICDNIREPGNLGAVLRTAAGVGAQNIILTKGCVNLWDTKVIRSACGAHFRLQIHTQMNWPDIKNHLNDMKSTVLIADNNIISENVTVQDELDTNDKIPESRNLSDIIVSMPLLPYYGANFSALGHLVLIIGGETEGISEESYRLAADCNGIRLNIPLSNDIDSLNTGTALGIIMFEIKRQLALVQQQKMEMVLS